MFCFSVFLWYFGEGCHLEAAKWEIGDRIQNYDTLNEEMIHHDWAGFKRPFNAVAFSALVEAFVRWDCCDDELLDLVDARAYESLSPFAYHLLSMAQGFCRVFDLEKATAAMEQAVELKLETVPCSSAWRVVPVEDVATEIVRVRPDLTPEDFLGSARMTLHRPRGGGGGRLAAGPRVRGPEHRAPSAQGGSVLLRQRFGHVRGVLGRGLHRLRWG